MNSLDPWRLIVVDSYGDVILPRPRYGHPFYSEIPSWIHYGNQDQRTRLLFDGAFIAGEVPAAPDTKGHPMTNNEKRTGLTAELAPVLAPATGGITVKKELDDKQVLHVEICVDGKCYRTSMDLAPAISLLMQKLASWHQSQHAQQPPPETVVSTVEKAVNAAQDALVGALVAQHIDTICGSFLGDIAGAVSSAASGIAGGVASTFKKLKGPIGAAAGIAAASGAALIPGVGPIAAPIAGKLANDLVQAAAGDDKAKQAIAQAQKQAASNPAVKAALKQATKAVANSTAAYHVQETAKQAARGDAGAQQQIVKVAEDAEKGDPAAKAVADLVANAMKSEWGAKLWEQLTGRGPSVISGWYDMIGSALDDVRENARAHANTKAGRAAGVMQTLDGRLHGRGFPKLDDAIDWLQRVARQRGNFVYAAAYEKDADGNAYIQDEEFGTTGQAPAPVPATTSGAVVGAFWDDVKNAVLTVTGTKATNQFIHDNHLEGIVGLAGQAVATYYGGPAAGAAAKALGPKIMSLGVEDKQKAQAAQSDVHGVKAIARQSSPQMAQAVDAAHGALEHTATAYQIAQILKDARAGVPPAQEAIANLQAAAARGDHRAAKALRALAAIDRAQQGSPSGPPPVSGWQNMVGVVLGAA